MRNSLVGRSDREAMLQTGEQLFHLPRAQLGKRAFERRAPPELRVRRVQKQPGLLAIVPNVSGRRDDTRQALGSLAFDGAQAVAPPFVSSFGDNPEHDSALSRGVVGKSPGDRPQRRFRDASLYQGRQLGQRLDRPVKDR